MDRIDSFIANIYRLGNRSNSTDFREDALRALAVQVPFDGALWGGGNREQRLFHSVATLGMPEEFPQALEKVSDISDILPVVLENLGTALNVADILTDEQYFNSEAYKRCYSRYQIERCLVYGELDERSNIYSFIGLYRFDRANGFTEEERAIFESAAFHLVRAAQNSFFMHLAHESSEHPDTACAICDSNGQFYQAQPDFLDLLQQRYPTWKEQKLPFEIPEVGQVAVRDGLCVSAIPYADMYCLRIWEERPTDILSDIDREIVDRVCKGMTFKEIARELGMAHTTVSNRLYRLYPRLGVTSRAALVRLIHGEEKFSKASIKG